MCGERDKSHVILDDRDICKRPVATPPSSKPHSPDLSPPSNDGNDHQQESFAKVVDSKRPKLNPIPNPKPKKKKAPTIEPITFIPAATPSRADSERKYYCYSKMQVNDKKCCSECRLVVRENIDTSWSLL
jgi:hypothetical protein